MENFITMGWSPHVAVTFWVLIGCLVLFFVTFFVAEKFMQGAEIGTALMAILSAIMIVSMAIALIPYDSKYHHYYRVSGTVESVSNVLSENGGDLTRTPIVKLDSMSQPVAINDPRAVELQDRDVELTCTVEWVYQSMDRYNCSIYDVK